MIAFRYLLLSERTPMIVLSGVLGQSLECIDLTRSRLRSTDDRGVL